MKPIKKLTSYICCIFFAANLLAQNIQMPANVPSLPGNMVDKEQARVVAKNFLAERMANRQMLKSSEAIVLADVSTLEVNGLPALYVFTNHGEGFVIVSADQALTPVIGYSSEDAFPEKGVNPNFDSYLETYLGQIEWVRKQPSSGTSEIKTQWQKYRTGEFNFYKAGTNDVGPLLTCLWNIDGPYNVLCPKDAAGPEGHVYAGCAANAMSMIMYYYRYPLHGFGVHSYSAAGYGTQSVNYATTWYDWDGMLDKLNNASRQSIPAVALLEYNAGVSVNMIYHPDGSGALSEDVPAALIQHFGYSSSTQYISRSDYNSTDWENIVVGQLDSLNPIYFDGFQPNVSAGHAFVCDGYQLTGSTRMYHFNFGFGGSGNGYYTLSNPDGWTLSQDLIRNIYPASGYPFGCSNNTIKNADGSFEDGSSPKYNYKPNLNCTWLIDPADSINSIMLTFNTFDVDVSDSVYIYDGGNETEALLGVYSGTTIPPMVTSSGGKMFLRFKTDGSNESKGWTAEYHSVYPDYCHGITTLTSAIGSFSDGSGDNNYNNNANCKWKIQPPNADTITLKFSSFDLEENDMLKVYSTGNSTTLLGTYTGKQKPEPIVDTSGAILLVFNANGYNTATGFDAEYTTLMDGTEELNSFPDLTLSPNPAKDFTVLRLNNPQAHNIQLTITDITGKQLYSEMMEGTKSNLEKIINLGSFKPGMYFLSLKTAKSTSASKLIVK
jgi:hypothetical protein